MQSTIFKRMDGQGGIGGYAMAVLPRLPRIVAITVLAMGLAFIGVHFQPARYEASLDLPLVADVPVDQQVADFLDPVHLADIVVRLPQAVVQELRASDEQADSITLLRRTLTLAPAKDGESLKISAIARNEANALAIAQAIRASSAPEQGLAEAPPVAERLPSGPAALIGAPQAAPLSNADLGVLQQRMTLAWENRVTLEEKAKRIEALIASDDVAALGLYADGLPGLSRRLEDLSMLEAERKKLAVTLLPNHPNMRAVVEEIAMANADIREQAGQLAAMMRADSEAASRLEATLRSQYESQLASQLVDDTILTGSVDGDGTPRVTPLPRPIGTSLALGLAGGFAFFGQLGLIALKHPIAPRSDADPSARRAPRKRGRKPVAPPTEDMAMAPVSPDEELVQAPEAFEEVPQRDAAVPPLTEIEPAHVEAVSSVEISEPVLEAVSENAEKMSDAGMETPPLALTGKAAEPLRAPQGEAHNWFDKSVVPPEVPIVASWTIAPPTEGYRAANLEASPAPRGDVPAANAPASLEDARIVAIRSRGTPGDTRARARELLELYADAGKRVVLIDAASRRRGTAPGISDLSLGKASFADIIHGTGAEVAALIPWGRQDVLYASARPVRTLLLALVELYDVVVITLDAEEDGSSHLARMADLVLIAGPTGATRRQPRVANW